MVYLSLSSPLGNGYSFASTFPNPNTMLWGLDTKSRAPVLCVDTHFPPPPILSRYLSVFYSLTHSVCDARAIRAIDSRLTIWRVLNRLARASFFFMPRRVCVCTLYTPLLYASKSFKISVPIRRLWRNEKDIYICPTSFLCQSLRPCVCVRS